MSSQPTLGHLRHSELAVVDVVVDYQHVSARQQIAEWEAAGALHGCLCDSDLSYLLLSDRTPVKHIEDSWVERLDHFKLVVGDEAGLCLDNALSVVGEMRRVSASIVRACVLGGLRAVSSSAFLKERASLSLSAYCRVWKRTDIAVRLSTSSMPLRVAFQDSTRAVVRIPKVVI